MRGVADEAEVLLDLRVAGTCLVKISGGELAEEHF